MISPTSHLENTLHQMAQITHMFSETLKNTMTINKEENDNLDTKIQKFITMKLFSGCSKTAKFKVE